MSNARMTMAWKLSLCKGSTLLLLIALADQADDDGYCWPGINHLATKTRVTRQTVMAGLKELEECGELCIAHSTRGNRYLVAVGLSEMEISEALVKRFSIPLEQATLVAKSMISLRQNHKSGSQKSLHPKSKDLTPEVNFGIHDPSLPLMGSSNNLSDAQNASEGTETSLSSPQSVTESVTEEPPEQEPDENGPRHVECDENGVPLEDIPNQRMQGTRPRKGDELEARFLNAVNALSWWPGTVKKGRAIIASYRRGLEMERQLGMARVYQVCFDEVAKCHEPHLKSPPGVIPATWWEDRLENAQKHRWALVRKQEGQVGLIDNFLKRDKLLEHCKCQLNLLNVKGSAAESYTPEGERIIRIGDGKMPLPPDGIIRI